MCERFFRWVQEISVMWEFFFFLVFPVRGFLLRSETVFDLWGPFLGERFCFWQDLCEMFWYFLTDLFFFCSVWFFWVYLWEISFNVSWWVESLHQFFFFVEWEVFCCMIFFFSLCDISVWESFLLTHASFFRRVQQVLCCAREVLDAQTGRKVSLVKFEIESYLRFGVLQFLLVVSVHGGFGCLVART